MIGAIVGNIAGSIYEFHNIKTRKFTLFADYQGPRGTPALAPPHVLRVATCQKQAAAL